MNGIFDWAAAPKPMSERIQPLLVDIALVALIILLLSIAVYVIVRTVRK